MLSLGMSAPALITPVRLLLRIRFRRCLAVSSAGVLPAAILTALPSLLFRVLPAAVLALYALIFLPVALVLPASAALALLFLSAARLLSLLPFFLFQALQLLKLFPGQLHLLFLAVFTPEMQLFYRILLNFLLVPGIYHHLHQLAQNIDTLHLALQPAFDGDIVSDIGKPSV